MNTLNESVNIILQVQKIDLLKIFLPPTISFLVGMLSVPYILRFMEKYDLRKKKSVALSIDGKPATFASKIDNDEGKILYRMGALVAFAGLFGALAIFRVLPVIFHDDNIAKLNFLSRGQTWMPIAAMIGGIIIGAFDDLIVCGRLRRFSRYVGDGLSLKVRLGFALMLALVCAWWMTDKLDMSKVYIPFVGTGIEVGWIIFSLIAIGAIVVTYAGSVIDGVDGLSGGVFSLIYLTLGIICFMESRYDLAALCFAIVGGLLAFLWFNIPPARFMLSDIGSMPLTIVMAIIALLSDAVFVLPIISAPLVWSIGSVVIQLLSKKIRHKKVFIASPLHLHLQVKGWPKHMVSMRYWILTSLCCALGLIIFVSGGYF